MELTAIIAGLLLAAGGLVALGGLALSAWVAGHQDLLAAAARLAADLAGRLAGLARRRPGRPAGERGTAGRAAAGTPGPRVGPGRRAGPGEGALALTLILGLAVVTLAAVGVGTLVDNATDGDGVAVLDHPAARFVAAHREPALTTAMRVVSTAGGPAGMMVLALAAGLLLGIAWRSWTPVAVLAVTAVGVIGLTVVFKAALGRPRPPLAQAISGSTPPAWCSGAGCRSAARR